MKNYIGIFIGGFFLALWITAKWCTPSSTHNGGDTLSHTSETLFVSGTDTVIIKEFHYSKETHNNVPVLVPAQKDSVIQDYFTERVFDSLFYDSLNYRERIRIRLSENHLKEFWREFENLRPTVIQNTAIVVDKRSTKLYWGAAAGIPDGKIDIDLSMAILTPTDQIWGLDYNISSSNPLAERFRLRYYQKFIFKPP